MQARNFSKTIARLDNSLGQKKPAVSSPDGHFHTRLQQSAKRSSILPSVAGLIDSHPTLQILVSELGSVLVRIRFRLSRQFRHVSMGPAFQLGPNGERQECNRRRTCMIDTGRFFSSRKWATLLDVQTFVEGWNKGAEFASGTVDSGTPGTVDKRA